MHHRKVDSIYYYDHYNPCSFEYENTRFTSTEQCFQFNRARACNEVNSAHRIIITDDPFVCKHIGGSVEETSEWSKESEAVMYNINKLKFEQNPHLLDRLLATGERILQEATTSTTWGIGAGIRSKAARENTATGDNILGKLLMRLRSEFSAEYSLSQIDN